MAVMITLTLLIATAVIASQLTALFSACQEEADAPGYGALAPVWREGYLAGVVDERTSAAWDVPGYGPTRGNPYPGPEQPVQHARSAGPLQTTSRTIRQRTGNPMKISRTAAALTIATAILTLTACGGPSAESNSKDVAKSLLVRDTTSAMKLMTPEQQQRAKGLSGGDILGNDSRMPAECVLGETTSSEQDGATVTLTPMDCPDGDFTLKMTVVGESKLIDRITYQ